MTMFAAVADNGETPSDNPKLDAYKYMAMLQRQGRQTSLVVSDGKYKVESVGLAPLVFVPLPYYRCHACGTENPKKHVLRCPIGSPRYPR